MVAEENKKDVSEESKKDANVAIAKEAVAGALKGMSVVKEIYVPDRIVNFVVK